MTLLKEICSKWLTSVQFMCSFTSGANEVHGISAAAACWRQETHIFGEDGVQFRAVNDERHKPQDQVENCRNGKGPRNTSLDSLPQSYACITYYVIVAHTHRCSIRLSDIV